MDPDGTFVILAYPVAVWVGNAAVLGVAAAINYSFAKKSKVDPFARPHQKKQGRERKEKKKGAKSWKQNPNKKAKPSPKHTPSRDHQKF